MGGGGDWKIKTMGNVEVKRYFQFHSHICQVLKEYCRWCIVMILVLSRPFWCIVRYYVIYVYYFVKNLWCFYNFFLNWIDGLKTNTTISVLNANTMDSPKGTINEITGVAYIPNPSKPGQLKVDLDGVPLPGDCECLVAKIFSLHK